MKNKQDKGNEVRKFPESKVLGNSYFFLIFTLFENVYKMSYFWNLYIFYIEKNRGKIEEKIKRKNIMIFLLRIWVKISRSARNFFSWNETFWIIFKQCKILWKRALHLKIAWTVAKKPSERVHWAVVLKLLLFPLHS